MRVPPHARPLSQPPRKSGDVLVHLSHHQPPRLGAFPYPNNLTTTPHSRTLYTTRRTSMACCQRTPATRRPKLGHFNSNTPFHKDLRKGSFELNHAKPRPPVTPPASTDKYPVGPTPSQFKAEARLYSSGHSGESDCAHWCGWIAVSNFPIVSY